MSVKCYSDAWKTHIKIRTFTINHSSSSYPNWKMLSVTKESNKIKLIPVKSSSNWYCAIIKNEYPPYGYTSNGCYHNLYFGKLLLLLLSFVQHLVFHSFQRKGMKKKTFCFFAAQFFFRLLLFLFLFCIHFRKFVFLLFAFRFVLYSRHSFYFITCSFILYSLHNVCCIVQAFEQDLLYPSNFVSREFFSFCAQFICCENALAFEFEIQMKQQKWRIKSKK